MGLLVESRKLAVAYYRHSAEDKQENSVPIQRERVQKFARENAIEIMHEEADQGKSGLSAARPGFQNLLRDWILNSGVKFDFVLVLDVSRFGRFQNQNEAAHYEYLCDMAGKPVWYVDHGPVKETRQPMDYLQTSIQRISAADFSRQLSEKVFHGSVKVSEQGYSAGGSSCYGMGRLLLDASRKPIRLLKPGEHKQISNERVTFTPLNDQPTKTVVDIFLLFVKEYKSPKDIAETLNAQGIQSAHGRLWDSGKIIRILMNETYAGTRIYNKTWGKLHQKKRRNPRSEWIVCPRAFPAIINPDLFGAAQRRLRWLLPTRRRKGVLLIKKLEKQMINELIAWLHSKNPASESSPDPAVFPLVFSVRASHQPVGRWYFAISEELRSFPIVLGVGISLDGPETIERVFAIPTEDFGKHNVLAFSDHSGNFAKYRIEKDQIEEKILITMLRKNVSTSAERAR